MKAGVDSSMKATNSSTAPPYRRNSGVQTRQLVGCRAIQGVMAAGSAQTRPSHTASNRSPCHHRWDHAPACSTRGASQIARPSRVSHNTSKVASMGRQRGRSTALKASKVNVRCARGEKGSGRVAVLMRMDMAGAIAPVAT